MAQIKHAYMITSEYSDLSADIHAEISDALDQIKDYVAGSVDNEDLINETYEPMELGDYTFYPYDIAYSECIVDEIIDGILDNEIDYYRYNDSHIFGCTDHIGASGDVEIYGWIYTITHIIQIIDDSGNVHNVTDSDELDDMVNVDDPIIVTADDGTMWTYDGETIAEYVPEPETWTLNLILIRDHVPTIYTAVFATRTAVCQLYVKWVEYGGSSVDMDGHNLTLIRVL